MASLEKFIDTVSAKQNLMLDTNAVIYFLDCTPPFADLLMPLFELIENGRIKACLSVITESELLVKPYREKNAAAIETINFFLNEFPNLKTIPVSREISRQAAKIRADFDIRLPDAIILASALNNECDMIVGNDFKLMQKAKTLLPVVLLNDFK